MTRKPTIKFSKDVWRPSGSHRHTVVNTTSSSLCLKHAGGRPTKKKVDPKFDRLRLYIATTLHRENYWWRNADRQPLPLGDRAACIKMKMSRSGFTIYAPNTKTNRWVFFAPLSAISVYHMLRRLQMLGEIENCQSWVEGAVSKRVIGELSLYPQDLMIRYFRHAKSVLPEGITIGTNPWDDRLPFMITVLGLRNANFFKRAIEIHGLPEKFRRWGRKKLENEEEQRWSGMMFEDETMDEETMETRCVGRCVGKEASFCGQSSLIVRLLTWKHCWSKSTSSCALAKKWKSMLAPICGH